MRSPTFSRRTGRVKASAIREILKVTERPEILSFAGGLPAGTLCSTGGAGWGWPVCASAKGA